MASSSGSSMLVHDVWADTSDTSFEEIKALLCRGAGAEYKVGFDSEFAIPNGVVLSGREPPTKEYHYAELCKKVNGGDLVQMWGAVGRVWGAANGASREDPSGWV